MKLKLWSKDQLFIETAIKLTKVDARQKHVSFDNYVIAISVDRARSCKTETMTITMDKGRHEVEHARV